MSDRMPCGGCEAGTYAVGAVRGGLRLFGGIGSQREALKAAPRCQHEPQHICFGALDFILGCDWPLDAKAMAEIEGWISQ